MDEKNFEEVVYAALKKALETMERKVIAEESGIDYHTVSAFLRRKTASVTTLNALFNVLQKHGYTQAQTLIAQDAAPIYTLHSGTEQVIAADLRAAADVVASALPTEIKTDKLQTLKTHLQAYINALEGANPGKKKRANS